MKIQWLVIFFLCLCRQVVAEELKSVPEDLSLERTHIERAGEITIKPEALILARAIVSDVVGDTPPDAVLGLVAEIAKALSEEHLCGTEAIQAMVDTGIPFDMALDAIVKACNLDGPELAALNRSLSPGMAGHGGAGAGGASGPGVEVSP